jgi:hypothetical protein
MSETSSDRRKMKELKVLELHREGYSYRKIASSVHLSLRDVTKYIHRISNKTKSPSTTSVMDEVVLEYRVNMLRSEVRDLEIQIGNLKDELEDLRAQKTHYLILIFSIFVNCTIASGCNGQASSSAPC